MENLDSYEVVVLLIDDQPMIAEAVRRALASEADIEFHYCADPTKAIKTASQIKPTIILQDLVMPEIDGLTMVRFFRANPATRDVPIIVLSVKEEAEVKSDCFAMGVNDYLVKLPAKIELIARIRHHSKAYIIQKQRDEAFRQLQESQERLAEANRILQRLSSLDGLTGIANRRRFDEALDHEWQRALRNQEQFSLILLDIDFFKLYNDNYGHQRGDDCLKQVAGVLERSIKRDADLIARYGGEEFAAILPDTEPEGAIAVAEGMRARLGELQIPHEKSKVSDYVTISIGVSTVVPDKDTTAETLLARADEALYMAKEGGRDRVKFLELEIDAARASSAS